MIGSVPVFAFFRLGVCSTEADFFVAICLNLCYPE